MIAFHSYFRECMRMHAFILTRPIASLWKSASNLEESVLSFLSVGSGIWTLVISLGNKGLFPLDLFGSHYRIINWKSFPIILILLYWSYNQNVFSFFWDFFSVVYTKISYFLTFHIKFLIFQCSSFPCFLCVHINFSFCIFSVLSLYVFSLNYFFSVWSLDLVLHFKHYNWCSVDT